MTKELSAVTITDNSTMSTSVEQPPPGPGDDTPQDDDRDHEPLPIRPMRQRLGPLSLLLGGLFIAALAFGGGVTLEKHHVTPTAATATPTAATTATTRTGSAGASATAGGVGGSTVGTVRLVDGTNIYVTETSGTIVKVATNPQSQITVTAAGTVRSINPGDTVVVSGAAAANGTVTATSVRDSGAGGSVTGATGRPAGGGTSSAGTAGPAAASGAGG